MGCVVEKHNRTPKNRGMLSNCSASGSKEVAFQSKQEQEIVMLVFIVQRRCARSVPAFRHQLYVLLTRVDMEEHEEISTSHPLWQWICKFSGWRGYSAGNGIHHRELSIFIADDSNCVLSIFCSMQRKIEIISSVWRIDMGGSDHKALWAVSRLTM